MPSIRDTTQTLIASTNGDRAAAARLLPLVYDELRALAGQYMQRERAGHTLQATAVVHEAYLRLVDQTKVDWKDKTHFLAVAAEMVRRILVDHARKHAAAKRGGRRCKVSFHEGPAASGPKHAADIIALDEALQELSKLSERQARVVELRFLGGLGVAEAAYAMGVSERTVKGDWRIAKAWLRQRIGR